MLPAERQLRSLHLDFCNPAPAQSMRTPIILLNWLELVQATVQISSVQLTLGWLTMEETAERLSELATCSITIQHCPLRGHDGSLSRHGVADMARYMERQFGNRVAVTFDWDDDCCTFVRVGRMH